MALSAVRNGGLTRRVASLRSLSTAADILEFPRPGFNYNLAASLGGDGVTARGEIFRNADMKTLLAAMPRNVVNNKRIINSGNEHFDSEIFATDSLPGAKVMDIEDFEARSQSVRSSCLSYAPHLFVEDGVCGSSREAQLYVRIISDCPVIAAAARCMVHRTPLYDPEIFPRTVTVYAATLASAAIGAGATPVQAAGSFAPYTAIDVDTKAARASVLSVGRASLASLRNAIAAAAATLQHNGGYRHVAGGSNNPNIREARADGILDWYVRDGHYYAPATEQHPDLITLQNSDVIVDGEKTALVVGTKGQVAAAAAAAGRLYAAHSAVWHAAGISAQFGALLMPAGKDTTGKLQTQLQNVYGSAVVPLSSPKTVVAPSRIIVVGEGGVEQKALLDTISVGKWQARKAAVTTVASEADAIKALGL